MGASANGMAGQERLGSELGGGGEIKLRSMWEKLTTTPEETAGKVEEPCIVLVLSSAGSPGRKKYVTPPDILGTPLAGGYQKKLLKGIGSGNAKTGPGGGGPKECSEG